MKRGNSCKTEGTQTLFPATLVKFAWRAQKIFYNSTIVYCNIWFLTGYIHLNMAVGSRTTFVAWLSRNITGISKMQNDRYQNIETFRKAANFVISKTKLLYSG